ncbi:MAG: DUF3806 domain-containing protein [Bacteroidetes bacterium]|nr:DUF3806 domain-containing protein [Bacteroidota bacterium]
MKTALKDLSEQDLETLGRLKEMYLRYLQTFAAELKESAFETKTIDIVFFRCCKEDQTLCGQIVPAIAYAMGHHFITELHYEWKINDDHFGQEYVLVSANGSQVVYPFSLVQQKFEKHECGFVKKLASMFAELQ